MMMRILAALGLLASTLTLAAPGDLDPAFGSGGKVVVRIGEVPTAASSVVALASGKILIAGSRGAPPTSPFLMVRINADGTLDTSFGDGGTVVTTDQSGFDVVEQPDAKILVAAHDSTTDTSARLLRFNADGSRDLSFGSGGIVGTDHVDRMRLQPDGSIVTVGSRFAGPPENTFYFVMRRFLASGAVDTSFGTSGRQDIAMALSPFSAATALAVQSDGKYVVAGYAFNGADYDVIALRTLADGTPDATFGIDGEQVTAVGSSHDIPRDMAIQADGRIVMVGESHSGGSPGYMILRYLANGTLDPAFGTGGVVLPAGNVPASLNAVALQADGKIVAAGYESSGGTMSFSAMRYSLDGQPDASFGTFGAAGKIVLTASVTAPAHAEDVALQADGRIVLVGTAGTRLEAIRLTSAGLLDSSFASGGRFSRVLVESTDVGMRSVKVRPNGKIVAAGHAAGSTGLVQLNPDGSLDTSFGVGGKLRSGFEDNAGAFSMILQDDGSLVVASLDLHASPSTCRITRYNPAGSIDTNFGNSGSRTFAASEVEDPRAAVAFTPDGKIVAACPGPAPGYHAQIIRLLGDGSLDASFGSGGIASLNISSSFDMVSSIAVQADGRIVVAGGDRGPSGSGNYRILVARLETNGTLDPSQAWHFQFAGANAFGRSVLLQPDGRIVVAATADIGNGTPDIGIIRLRPDGSLDPAFGSGGKVAIDASGWSAAEQVVLAPNGWLYVAGVDGYNSNPNTMSLRRLRPNGSVDTSFGNAGVALVPMDPLMKAWGVALQLDGNVVLAGGPYRDAAQAAGAPPQGAVIARFVGGGSPVTRFDFDSSGHPDVIFRNSTGGDTYVWRMNGLALQSDQLLANVDPSWRMVGHGDFNGDGKNDVVWRNMATGATFVWYLNDGVLVSDAFLFSIDPVWMIEAVDDFDHDGHPDFLFRHQSSGLAFIWYFNNTTPVRDQFLFSIDNSWIVEGTGDFNNDGFPDFFFRNTSSGLGFVWYWDGSALGASNFLFSIDPAWQVVQIVDWNGDGFVDLLFHNAASGVTFVWYTNGTSLQGSDFLFQVDPAWEIVPYR